MSFTSIPRFLLPRGLPSAHALRGNAIANRHDRPVRLLLFHSAEAASSIPRRRHPASSACFSTSRKLATPGSSSSSRNSEKTQRVLEKPDRFRPPSHPARRVLPTRNGKVVAADPVNYPGPQLTAPELAERKHRRYPHMFPPEGTVMYQFLTSRWIHIWIAMSVLTTLATFTFVTNFKHSSPFAHLLPPWSGLLSHPVETVSQAVSVYKMHVQHTSMVTREKRHRRVEDAEKRRQYRIAHGLEEPEKVAAREDVVDNQSPIAASAEEGKGVGGVTAAAGALTAGDDGSETYAEQAYVDWEGRRRPVKKWLGIW